MKNILIAAASFFAMSFSAEPHAAISRVADKYVDDVIIPAVCSQNDEDSICVEFTKLDALDLYEKGAAFKRMGIKFESPMAAGIIVAGSVHDEPDNVYNLHMAKLFEMGYEGK